MGTWLSIPCASISGQQIQFLAQGTHSFGPCSHCQPFPLELFFLSYLFFCLCSFLMDTCFSLATQNPFIKLYQLLFWLLHHSFFLRWFWTFMISSPETDFRIYEIMFGLCFPNQWKNKNCYGDHDSKHSLLTGQIGKCTPVKKFNWCFLKGKLQGAWWARKVVIIYGGYAKDWCLLSVWLHVSTRLIKNKHYCSLVRKESSVVSTNGRTPNRYLYTPNNKRKKAKDK